MVTAVVRITGVHAAFKIQQFNAAELDGIQALWQRIGAPLPPALDARLREMQARL